MNFSYLDQEDNVSIPPPMNNAGLYSGLPSTQTQWAKNYNVKRIEPDAVKYSSTYFELAKSHIPTNVRPGNNSIIDNKFVINYLKYNTLCYRD